MSRIYYVDPMTVDIQCWTLKSDIAKQRALLEEHGQIEPIVASRDENGEWSVNDDNWPYTCAQVWAARDLKFDTIMLVEGDDSD